MSETRNLIRLAVAGVQVAGGTAEPVTVGPESDVHVTLTGAEGASTTYVVHCLIEPLWVVETTKSPAATGILEDPALGSDHHGGQCGQRPFAAAGGGSAL